MVLFFLGHTISQVSASRLTTHRNDAAAFTIVPQIFVVICVSTVILIPTGSTVVFYLNQETLSFLQAVFSQVGPLSLRIMNYFELTISGGKLIFRQKET